MYRVRIKRFSNSIQYQIFEDNPVGRMDSMGDIPDYLLDKNLKKNEKLLYNPFTKKFEKMREYDEREEEEKRKESVRSSRSRTIRKIYDYGRSNVWDYFVTLTFDPAKVDSFNYVSVVDKLHIFLMHLRRKCPDLLYLCVPEQHKSGRWHFHLLMSNVENLDFVDSGKKTEAGQPIYNVGNYNLGFSTAIRLDGNMAVVSYLCKYITKDLCEATKNKKRYWVSRNVNSPEVLDHWVCDSLEDILYQIGLSDADHIKTVNGYKDVYYIDKKI